MSSRLLTAWYETSTTPENIDLALAPLTWVPSPFLIDDESSAAVEERRPSAFASAARRSPKAFRAASSPATVGMRKPPLGIGGVCPEVAEGMAEASRACQPARSS